MITLKISTFVLILIVVFLWGMVSGKNIKEEKRK